MNRPLKETMRRFGPDVYFSLVTVAYLLWRALILAQRVS